MSATFYKVHYVKNHVHHVEGGFSERNAQFFALRMHATPGVRDVEVIATNEVRPGIDRTSRGAWIETTNHGVY